MQTEDIIRRAVEAYSVGEDAALDALLSDELCYRINGQPDCGRFACDTHGKAAFYEAVGRILKKWVITDYRIVDLIVRGDRAAAQIAHGATHRISGRRFEARLALFFRVADGVISEIVEYHDTAALSQDG